LKTSLTRCGERLLCQDRESDQLVSLYRKSLAMELFKTVGLSEKNTARKILEHQESGHVLCNEELDKICPAELLV
jgi:hypothetical protein